jgi:hypothetical protein
MRSIAKTMIAAITLSGVALAGCGGGSGSGADYSSKAACAVETQFPAFAQSQGNSFKVSSVSCTRQGSSEKYVCNGTVAAPPTNFSQAGTFAVSCTTSGSCKWTGGGTTSASTTSSSGSSASTPGSQPSTADVSEVTSALKTYLTALANGDGQAACAQMTPGEAQASCRA